MKMKRHKCVDSMFCSDFFFALSTRLSIPLFASAISGDFFGTAAVFVAAAIFPLCISYEMEKNSAFVRIVVVVVFFHATIFHLSHEIGMSAKPKSHRINFTRDEYK